MVDLANLPTGPVSNRALARILGLASDNAVRAALRTGRLRRCILPGGLHPRMAVEEWQANTDPRQQRKVTCLTDTAAAAHSKRRAKAESAPPAPAKGKGRAKPRAPVSTPPAAPPSTSPPAARPGSEDLEARLAAHRAKRLAAASPKGSAPERDQVDDNGESIADIRRGMLLIDRMEKQFD